jgi:hypothetical protein
VDSTEAPVRVRELAIDRLNELTTWIAVGALAALSVFAVIAAETIPGKASSSQSTTTASTGSSTSTSSSSFGHHHHRDSSTISASSGPPVVVTGGSH